MSLTNNSAPGLIRPGLPAIGFLIRLSGQPPAPPHSDTSRDRQQAAKPEIRRRVKIPRAPSRTRGLLTVNPLNHLEQLSLRAAE